MKLQAKVPLNVFNEENGKLKDAEIVVIDGVIDDDIVNIAESTKIKTIVANKTKKDYKTKFLKIYTKEDLVF